MALEIKLKELRQDWEKIIVAVAVFIVAVLFIVFIINTFFAYNTPHESSVSASPQSSIFNENAFAFLYGITQLEKDEIPFNYRKPFRKPRPSYKPPPKDNYRPPPKPEKKGHIITYNGWLTLADTNEKLAFIKIRDFKTGKVLKSDSVHENSEIFDYTVLSIDEEKVIIRTPEGAEKEIPIHKNIKIIKNE